MTSADATSLDVVVIGAGPAGVVAALRAARLGARTALVARDELGGMAANDGPVPVRTLAHAARLMREASQLSRYGITAGHPELDYERLLDRVREVTDDVRTHALLREDLQQAGVTLHEHAGAASFAEPHVIECEHAPALRAAKSIICTGGMSRRLDLPGLDLACTHSDAWTLSSAPPSMLVIGAGATGVQLVSIFNAFGSQVTLFEAAPRILMSEDEDVAAAVNRALAASGIEVLEHAGTIERLEPNPAGVRLTYSHDGIARHIDATIAVVAIGWVANTTELNLPAAGVQHRPARLRRRGRPPSHQRAPHLRRRRRHRTRDGRPRSSPRGIPRSHQRSPRNDDRAPSRGQPPRQLHRPRIRLRRTHRDEGPQHHQVVVATQRFDSLPRPIIDGRPTGFCKLIADRQSHTILGCHIVGERAVELAQLAAIAMAADMKVEQLALVPFSFPTYANALGRAAIKAARELDIHGISTEDQGSEAAEAATLAG